MSNATDELAAVSPPLTPCPPWCTKGDHLWERDGDQWSRPHSSGEFTPDGDDQVLEIYAVDSFDGQFQRAEPVIARNGECLPLAEIAHLTEAARRAAQP